MSVHADEHPSTDMLAAYAQGRVDSVEIMSTVENHLNSCETCRLEVETAPLDGLGILLRDVSEATEPSHSRAISGYEIIEHVGQGGMGRVFKARQISLNRTVALKQLNVSQFESEEQRVRFRKEAEVLAHLNHPRIVQVLDFGESEGHPFIAMEFIEGIPLSELLRTGPLDFRAAALVVESLAEASQYAHSEGVIHRDLKPANVLISRPEQLTCDGVPGADKSALPVGLGVDNSVPGAPKLIDFGLARDLGSSRHTQTGAILGTPNYIAPEQIDGDPEQVLPAVDIYSLGATLYECLTGRPPFGGNTLLETLDQVRNLDPISLRRLRPQTPRDLETICLKCLNKNPQKRYDSSQELAEDLRRHLNGLPILARNVSVFELTTKWIRRHPAWAAFVFMIGTVTIGTAVGLAIHSSQLQEQVNRTIAQEMETDRQRRRAESNYQLARKALRSVLRRNEEAATTNVPELWKLTERQAVDAIAFFDDLSRTDDPDSVELLTDLIDIHRLLGSVRVELGNMSGALEVYQKAHLAAAKLKEKKPDDLSQKIYAGILIKLAFVKRTSSATVDEALAHADEALGIYRTIAASHPENPKELTDVAWSLHTLGVTHISLGNRPVALKYLSESHAIREQLSNIPDIRDDIRARGADDLANIGLIHWQNGDLFEANKTLEKAEQDLLQYLSDHPNDRHFTLSLAAVYINWSNVLNGLSNPRKSIELCTEGIARVETFYRVEPDGREIRERLFNLHGVRAQTKVALSLFDEAGADWSAMIPLSADDASRRLCIIQSALCCVRSGQHREAAERARKLLSETPGGDDIYNAACVMSLASKTAQNDNTLSGTARDQIVADYMDESFSMLARLRKLGYFKDEARLNHAINDSDLEPIKQDPRFKEVLLRDQCGL